MNATVDIVVISISVVGYVVAAISAAMILGPIFKSRRKELERYFDKVMDDDDESQD